MRVVVGVGGGIAAYKAAELVRALQQRGYDVQVVMTRAAEEFIRPLTFAALTGRKVITGLFAGAGQEDALSNAVEHIAVAQENDLLLVAPATADLLAKFAHGLADDFLSTLYLAFTGPVLLAPAMNSAMWEHPATRANLEILKRRGGDVIEPEEGPLACRTIGPGRLADVEMIVARVDAAVSRKHDFEGETVLITAGPTHEPIDPVRYIANRSSGKMGYALASEAAARGARVVLVSGPASIPEPRGVKLVRVRTAAEMRDAVLCHFKDASVIVMAAAVADYRVINASPQKLKKSGEHLSFELAPNPDILAELGARKSGRLLVGFAAETADLLDEARRKLAAKNCDMIVANWINREKTGFESEDNEVELVTASGTVIHAGPAPKTEIARRIFDEIAALKLSVRI
jgi:phosphopantothenoylcysteine decarboxylase/phosphopantothenate--cysteine ligase